MNNIALIIKIVIAVATAAGTIADAVSKHNKNKK